MNGVNLNLSEGVTLDEIWSEVYKRKLWRTVWCALAHAQAQLGVITREQWRDLEAHRHEIDINKALEIEQITRHDLMAELQVFAHQCPVGGGIIHLGATSADIEENADVLRLRASIEICRNRVFRILRAGYQPCTIAVLTLLSDVYHDLGTFHEGMLTKGFKGAVGTSASYGQLLNDKNASPQHMERIALEYLGISAFAVSTQISGRKQEYQLATVLVGCSILLIEAYKLLRPNASTHELNYLLYQADAIHAISGIAWDNASYSLLERSLDDSANRRWTLPNMFLYFDKLITNVEDATFEITM